jgi:hypothetical protein
MTQTQLRHLDITRRHPRPGFRQQLFRMQSNPTDKLERTLSRITVDPQLLGDRGCEGSFAYTEEDSLGFGGRGEEELEEGGELVRDDSWGEGMSAFIDG